MQEAMKSLKAQRARRRFASAGVHLGINSGAASVGNGDGRLEAFKAGRRAEAAERLEAILARHGEDGPSRELLRQCRDTVAGIAP
jgi:hypothetical protein